MLRFTILGCGSSGGVPRVGPDWGACDPDEPKNRRRRCSLLIERIGEAGATRVLVDTSPDLREQLLSAEVGEIDAVVYTHDHADHTHGVDDLRALCLRMRKRIPVHMDEAVETAMRRRFGYCFETPEGSSYPPILDARRFSHEETITVDGAGGAISVEPVPVNHGDIDALCLRVDDVAYMPDVKTIPAASEARLHGLDLLIVDALRETSHPSHFSLTDALDCIRRLAPRRAVLTNLHVDLDYRTLAKMLPEGVVPAYDGLQLET